MKKLLIASILMTGAYAQSLEDRVEALEYKSYENFFKVTGQLEYRFDAYEREDKKSFTELTTDSSGNTVAQTNAISKKSNSLNKVFLNLNLESKPSERLSFYGRLAMRKYVSVFSSSNASSSATGNAGDLGGSTPVGDDRLLVERAFANYVFSKRFTLSFGRLPTAQGAPYAFSRDEAQGGNYPFLLYSSYLDGIAGTFSIAEGHTVKLVYTPFSTVDYADNLEVKTATAYVAMYEFKKSFDWTDQFNFTLGHLHINKFSFSSAVANIDRYMFHSEMMGIAGTGLDMTIMFSHNRLENESLISNSIGWGSGELGKSDGNAWGIALRYAIMPTTKIGVEYFTADDDAWVTQSMTDDPFNFYANHGDAWKVFLTHRFDQTFRFVGGFITAQQDSQFQFANLLGRSVETDRTNQTIYSSLIANF